MIGFCALLVILAVFVWSYTAASRRRRRDLDEFGRVDEHTETMRALNSRLGHPSNRKPGQ